MTFTIQKRYLLSLGTWLSQLSLNGRLSRARSRVVDLIQDALVRVEKDRISVIEQYASKNDDGSFKIVEDANGGKNYDVPDELKPEFDKKISEMYDEDIELSGYECGPAFLAMKDVVLNYEKDIDPTIAGMYVKWCEAFESFPKVEALG